MKRKISVLVLIIILICSFVLISKGDNNPIISNDLREEFINNEYLINTKDIQIKAIDVGIYHLIQSAADKQKSWDSSLNDFIRMKYVHRLCHSNGIELSNINEIRQIVEEQFYNQAIANKQFAVEAGVTDEDLMDISMLINTYVDENARYFSEIYVSQYVDGETLLTTDEIHRLYKQYQNELDQVIENTKTAIDVNAHATVKKWISENNTLS